MLLYIDNHILNESKTWRKNVAMPNWIQKGILYGPTKLDNKLSQNVQNIRWSHKLYRENHQNLVSEIDSRREKLSWSKDPKRYIPRRCTITITIYNCNDATKPHTQEVHNRIQTYYSAVKDKSPDVHGRHQTVSQKWKRTGNSNTHRIYSEDIGIGFSIKKCAILVMKSGKRHFTDRTEQ